MFLFLTKLDYFQNNSFSIDHVIYFTLDRNRDIVSGEFYELRFSKSG